MATKDAADPWSERERIAMIICGIIGVILSLLMIYEIWGPLWSFMPPSWGESVIALIIGIINLIICGLIILAYAFKRLSDDMFIMLFAGIALLIFSNMAGVIPLILIVHFSLTHW